MLVINTVFLVGGYFPYGSRSLVAIDGAIQYIDFFGWFKDVLSGQSSIAYTMSKGLGGTGVAVFSYYLSSPFSLLVAFFPKNQIVACMTLAIVLKLATAGVTMSIYLDKRFSWSLDGVLVVSLSLAYALMQYSIAQASEVMWLDGVYMLPLILLSVWRLVDKGSVTSLAVTVGLSILFNWYSGAINCLFSIAWFILEMLVATCDNARRTSGHFGRDVLLAIVRYLVAMLLGVMLSCFLFLPTVAEFSASGRGTLGWELL